MFVLEVFQSHEKLMAMNPGSYFHSDSVPDVSIVPCVQLVLLLRWKSNEVIAVVANVLAEVAKSAAGRERLATLQPPIAQQLVNLLQQKSSDLTDSGNLAVVTQVCRALGNMCYESGEII